MWLSLSFIPDGNRRWALELGKNTLSWHTAGVEKIKEIIQWLNTENWQIDECVFWCLSRSNLDREIEELNGLFFLLKLYLKKFKKELIKNQVAFLALGEIYFLPKDIQKIIHQIEEETKQFIEKRRLGFWLAYDRDYDLMLATKKVIENHPELHDPREIEKLIRSEWNYARGMRDPDILIRTGAKKWKRTSGAFMGRETEIYFTETLWPDFSLESLKKIIQWIDKTTHTHGL